MNSKMCLLWVFMTQINFTFLLRAKYKITVKKLLLSLSLEENVIENEQVQSVNDAWIRCNTVMA